GVTGRWSASHPWIVVAAWIGGILVLLVTGHLSGTRQLSNAEMSVGQSGQAAHMISREFSQHASEYVLFESRSLRVRAPAEQAAIRDVLARIEETGRVTRIASPLDPRFAHQISPTGHAALLEFEVTGAVSNAATQVVPVLNAVRAAAAAHPHVSICETGDASIAKAVNDTVLRDLHRAEVLSFPLTLVVLLIAFGAVVARAGVDGHPRGQRPGGLYQSPFRRHAAGQFGNAAHRPGCRRGLLDVLCQTAARGTGRRKAGPRRD